MRYVMYTLLVVVTNLLLTLHPNIDDQLEEARMLHAQAPKLGLKQPPNSPAELLPSFNYTIITTIHHNRRHRHIYCCHYHCYHYRNHHNITIASTIIVSTTII